MRSSALRVARQPSGRPVPGWYNNKASVVSQPAPIGGWNARDQKSSMDPLDAYQLDNFIPDQTGVTQRQGVTQHATGMTGNFIESLMEHAAAGSSGKLFGAAPNNIYNVTSSGAVGSAEVTGLTNGRFQHTAMTTPGGHFLVICNGADDVRNYDGTTWTTPTINLVSSSSLINVCSHVARLWFVESGTLNIWYLDPTSIAGDAVKIGLGDVFTKGGELMAMGSWTRDGGAGMDDVAVFVSTKGEMLLYSGSDPDSPTTWGLIGRFNCPPPIGRRCFMKLGADLCYISALGILPLPQILAQNSAGVIKSAVTDKISGAFQEASLAAGTNFGWQVLEHTKRGLLLVNVPIKERVQSYQYVMNLKNGSWCRFTGINAGCMSLLGDDLYFGKNDGTSAKYGAVGVYDDDGEPINAIAIHAFQNYGSPAIKNFTGATPLITAPTGYLPQVRMLTDYNTALPTFTPAAFEDTGPYWDTELWNTVPWASGLQARAKFQSVTGIGRVGAIALASQTTRKLTYNAVDVMFESGGPI